MPPWPFGRSRPSGASPPSPLDAIKAGAPHRFRLTLTDQTQREAAVEVIARQLQGEVATTATEGSGGVVLELTSSFSPATAAILRPLNVLARAGIAVLDLEILDLVYEVDDASLLRAVGDWGEFANTDAYRLRLERLAGDELLERCLTEVARTSEQARRPRRQAWRFAADCVAFNTPGSESRLVQVAAATNDTRDAENFVGAAEQRVRLSVLTAASIDVPADALAALIRRPGYVSERAATLASSMPGPLPDPVVKALCDASVDSGERAARALVALMKAAPTAEVRVAVDAALDSPDADVRAQALGTLAHHWGAEARPVWRAFLASNSIPMRWAAEQVLGVHGTEEDVADAAAQLGKLIRSRSKLLMSPPRGNEIVDLLVRHRDHDVARAALDDLSARWERLPEDLRGWLAEHHPWLDPARRDDSPAEADASPEEPGAWPPPTVVREDGHIMLEFTEGAAHSEARDRFDELARAHPAIELLDGDREWMTIRVAGPAPERLVQELWEAASAGAGG